MPIVPNIIGRTVAQVANSPIFVTGFLTLAVMPPNAPTASTINQQAPAPGTMLDVGGVVTAMVSSQSRGQQRR